MEYIFRADDIHELESLERSMEILGGKISQEGWTTAYGGCGVTVWVQIGNPRIKKRDIKQIISLLDSVELIAVNPYTQQTPEHSLDA